MGGEFMPTRATDIVSKIIYFTILRKNCLQRLGDKIGVSFEYVPVLQHISNNPGCIQADISNKLKITPSAVTQSTKKLETSGLIKKEFDSSNLRIKKMYITDKGEKMLENGKIIFDEVDDIMFKGISDEEINQLNMLIDKVNKNISAYSPNFDEKHLPWQFNEK